MKSKFISLVAILGTIFVPIFVMADTLSSSNSLDSAIYLSGSDTSFFPQYPGNNTFNAGIQYRPGADHNVCNIQVLAITNGTSTPPILTLDVYNLNKTSPATSTSDKLTDGTFMKTADSSWEVTATTTYQKLTFTFTPCLFLNGGHYYNFNFRGSGNTYDQIIFPGADSNLARTQTYTGTGQFIFGVRVNSSNNWNTTNTSCLNGSNYLCFDFVINGVENFSNFTASSTTTYNSVTCTPPTSILDVGGGVSYGLCFMFVPSQQVIEQFDSIPAFMATKFPFSYVSSFLDALGNVSYNATSSLPLFDVDLHSLGIGSTTPMGNFLPEIKISTSTIGTYLSDSNRNILLGLQSIALWLGLVYYYYKRTINLIHT